LSQEEYASIRRIVFWYVPYDWCDRHDALQHGLLKALEGCRSHDFKSIRAYTVKAAYSYAYHTFFGPYERKKLAVDGIIAHKSNGDDIEESAWECLASTTDNYPHLNELDPVFVNQIEKALDQYEWNNGKDERGREKPHSISQIRAGRAKEVLRLLAESVRSDAGIGVDEFGSIRHDRENNTRNNGKYRVNYQYERRAVRKHIKERFGDNADRTMHALRQCTEKVIRECGY
jgi:hypothetical protein